MDKTEFSADERLDRKEQVLLEMLSYVSGYDAQPSLAYERRVQDGKDVLVLRVDGMSMPWLVGSEIREPDGDRTADGQLTESRRSVLHTMFVSATARAGRRLQSADGSSVASQVWEPAGEETSETVTDRRELALLALSHMDQLRWITSGDSGGVRLTLRLFGHAFEGKREAWVASAWTHGGELSIDRAKRRLSLMMLEQFIRKEACVIERHTAQHRARVAAEASA